MATNQTQAIPNKPTYGVAPVMPTEIHATGAAITLLAGGVVELTEAGASAMTLAAPAGNGALLFISSKTAQAHTVTISAGLHGLGAGEDVLTWGGAIDDCIILVSVGGNWAQAANVNVTVA